MADFNQSYQLRLLMHSTCRQDLIETEHKRPERDRISKLKKYIDRT